MKNPTGHHAGKTWEELDGLAWDVIRTWPVHAEITTMHEGLDWAHLTRYHLWDRVGRAIRRDADPEGFEREIGLMKNPGSDTRGAPYANAPPKRSDMARLLPTNLRPLGRSIYQQCQAGWMNLLKALRYESGAGDMTTVYIPLPAFLLDRTLDELGTQQGIRVCISRQTGKQIPGTHPVPVPADVKEPDLEFGRELFKSMIRGLARLDIRLVDQDAETLETCIIEQMWHIRRIEEEYRLVQPQIVLLQSDNHPPFIDYVLVARRAGIKSFMLQHGLDCERFYLDDAYASNIAVWGESRMERYMRNTEFPPTNITITGNPSYDELPAPEKHPDNNGPWLWATRPHGPARCYAPSRRVGEGYDILEAIITAMTRKPLQKLVIKPHPAERIELLHMLITAKQMDNRISITQDPLDALLQSASLVITEDSTAGLDAMLYGNIMIHAHLSPSEPVVNFTEGGAALPGFSHEQLVYSLMRAGDLDWVEREAMRNAQMIFIGNQVGEVDGGASNRLAKYIIQSLYG